MSIEAVTLDSSSPEATHRIGQRLGTALGPGDVVALIGPLGSGKTTLVKGIAEGAGVEDLRQVNSPTFVIVNEYEARTRGGAWWIRHVDAYRLRGSGDLEALGFDEMLAGGAVVVEWADRVADLLPSDALTIRLEPVGEQQRRVHCSPGGPAACELLTALAVRSP